MRRHCALHVGAIPFLTSFSRYFLLSFDASCSPAPRAQSAPAITHVSSSHSHASCASRIIFMASLPIFLFFFTSLSSFFSRFTPHRSFRPVVPTPQFFAFFLTQLIVSILSPSVYSNMRLFVISLFFCAPSLRGKHRIPTKRHGWSPVLEFGMPRRQAGSYYISFSTFNVCSYLLFKPKQHFYPNALGKEPHLLSAHPCIHPGMRACIGMYTLPPSVPLQVSEHSNCIFTNECV